MVNMIRQFLRKEEGASAAEYALLISLITLGLVVAVQNLGNAISGALAAATGVINGAS
jgi:Flp pilus assembly pilin Flp